MKDSGDGRTQVLDTDPHVGLKEEKEGRFNALPVVILLVMRAFQLRKQDKKLLLRKWVRIPTWGILIHQWSSASNLNVKTLQ